MFAQLAQLPEQHFVARDFADAVLRRFGGRNGPGERDLLPRFERRAARVGELGRAGDAEILDAQALMAVDPAIVDEAVRLVRRGMAPVDAVLEAAEAAAQMLDALPDPLLAARAGDVRDVAVRVTRILSGATLDFRETAMNMTCGGADYTRAP